MKERLDRGVANLTWCNLFPTAKVLVDSTVNLDHVVLMLYLLGQQHRRNRGKKFRYEASWTLDRGYND